MATTNNVLRLPDVMKITGMKKPTIYYGIRRGTFPKPIKLGERMSGWMESDIQIWIAGRIAASAAK